MPNGIADDLRRAFGDQTRSVEAPDLAPVPTGSPREAVKSVKSDNQSPVAGKMPSMTLFQGLMRKVSAMPNEILTKAVAADPTLAEVVRPYMAGEAPIEAIMVPLVSRIVETSSKKPDMAVAEFLKRFGGAK